MALPRYLVAWIALTVVACVVAYERSRIVFGPLPDRETQVWVYMWLGAAAAGTDRPAPPESARSYRAAGPILVSAYEGGKLRGRYVGSDNLIETLARAATKLREEGQFDPSRVFRAVVTRGEGPLVADIPGLSLFSLVPLRDGLVARTADGRTAYLTPDDLMEREAYDRAVKPPIPDLTFGTALPPLFEDLARTLEVDPAHLRDEAEVRRVVFTPLTAAPERTTFTQAEILAAAREHARFILRHQTPEGRYAYVYDARRDRVRPGSGYSLTRHAGTTFFLAQAARILNMPEARDGAMRALHFVRDEALTTCGAPERKCAIWREEVEIGASALAALAGAELLRSGDDPDVRDLTRGLLAFLRSQQRPDGELMHEYDREHGKPIDVQHMYYSGESALALFAGFEALGNPEDKAAGKRLMTHLTGAGWSFFGARYFYGEEHWTCQAVGRAAPHMDVSRAVDFCLRWGGYQGRLQYGPDHTPWQVSGAFGVGPVLLPRVTMAASRVEALVPIYRLQLERGRQDEPLRMLLERSIGLLLRMGWDGRETHLFARPVAAMGGMPSTMAELHSRADMVQHAGSALLGWAELHTRSSLRANSPRSNARAASATSH